MTRQRNEYGKNNFKDKLQEDSNKRPMKKVILLCQLCTMDDDDQNTDQSITQADFSYATQIFLTKFLTELVTSNCKVTKICGQNAYEGHPQLQI